MNEDSASLAAASVSSLPGRVILQDPLWIDLHNPTLAQMETVAGHFGFHPLSVEDALDPRAQRPKLDRYDTYRYLIFYEFGQPSEDEAIQPTEFHIFWAQDYVVTVHQEQAGIVDEARR